MSIAIATDFNMAELFVADETGVHRSGLGGEEAVVIDEMSSTESNCKFLSLAPVLALAPVLCSPSRAVKNSRTLVIFRAKS